MVGMFSFCVFIGWRIKDQPDVVSLQCGLPLVWLHRYVQRDLSYSKRGGRGQYADLVETRFAFRDQGTQVGVREMDGHSAAKGSKENEESRKRGSPYRLPLFHMTIPRISMG